MKESARIYGASNSIEENTNTKIRKEANRVGGPGLDGGLSEECGLCYFIIMATPGRRVIVFML